MENITELNPNPLVSFIGKTKGDFTKADLIHYIEQRNIEMINFRYAGGDGRLKTLNFIIQNKKHLDYLLSGGERVDGSSLFPNIEASASDLYVIPEFRTAFVNPFSKVPSIDILCSYFNKEGDPLESSPEYILKKAHRALKEKTGLSFEVMGELEYYIISKKEEVFLADNQKGYHESSPFGKWEALRTEAMRLITQAGGNIKYGHSEVGNFMLGDNYFEQNEIEFTPDTLEDSANQLLIAKWIIRSLAHKNGVSVTFAPKITSGKAGSGLHIHTRLVKDGQNMMIANGKLSDTALKAIAGYLDLAKSLTAFGNTNPASYLRLVPHQEAPTNICWGDRNRSVLIRVPLGWAVNSDMCKKVNPLENHTAYDFSGKQTVEFRCPDGSADIYLLLAGLTVAVRHGMEMDNALEYSRERYVDVNIFKEEHKSMADRLDKLPSSCFESASCLEQHISVYSKYNVFPESILKGIIKKLKSYDDQNIRESLLNEEDIMALVNRFIHCG